MIVMIFWDDDENGTCTLKQRIYWIRQIKKVSFIQRSQAILF